MVGFDTGDEWGFMYADGKLKTFMNDFHNWPELKKNKSGFSFNNKGIFVYDTFYPKTQSLNMNHKAVPSASGTDILPQRDTFWKIISFIPYDYLLTRKKMIFWFVAIAIILLSGVFSFFYSGFKYRLFLSRENEKKHYTEIRSMNRKLEEKNIKLTEINKQLDIANTTKTIFFSIIAHDIKTPLISLIGFPELILKRSSTFSKEEIIKLIEKTKVAADNLYEMIKGLLDWSSSQLSSHVLQIEQIDLAEIINTNISLLKPAADAKGICLVSEISGSPSAFVDKNAITTVFRNLLSNAIKFTKQSGNIVIREKQSAGFVEISVADDGVGIAPEDLPNIFKIDVKTTRKGTKDEIGTGLGLPLCYELVKKSNGEIWAESEFNEGSTFIVKLPAQVYRI
jgi:signal transduction histidine kinase